MATIIFQHCLNPLRHGVHQSFTGCHWSSLQFLHDDIAELGDVRDLALLHAPLPFEDAPQNTLTLCFFCKAVVVLEMCLGSLSCWNTALRPSLRREGIMLCFSMSQYMLALMVHSMNCSSPVPVFCRFVLPYQILLHPIKTVGRRHLFIFGTNIKIFLMKSNNFLTLQRQQRSYHIQGTER